MTPMADADPNPDSEQTPWARTLQPGEEATVPSRSDQHSITQLLNFHQPRQHGPHVGSGDAEPEDCPHSRVVNVGADNEMVVYGYRWSWWRAVPSTLLGLLTGGMLLLALHSRPQWQAWCFCAPCPLQDAEHVLMKTTIRYVQHQSVRYIWDPSKRAFVVLRGLEQNVSCSDLHKYYQDGLVYQESQNRKLIYGPNVIAVQVPPYRKLLGKEVRTVHGKLLSLSLH
ncbi:probable cation-transporting ATPase 13A5 [Mobula birostris]|uniref:probable cation-transporting ATPase 13A5 n=1 Tax=Mobula birostris TaxID=1983395 RepID=UPI003B281D13